jgi:hypothetical protein
MLERLIQVRLMSHLQASNNFNQLQSAYRSGVLLEILDGLYTAIDSKRVTVLISLDLSATFDTISSSILLWRLHDEFMLAGMSLKWFTSYFSGVPQGSVLEPVLFATYMLPVGHVVTSFDIEHHQ